MKLSCRLSRGLEPLIKHKGGYGSSIDAAEDPSILKVQVSWDEHQEQKEQESEVNQSLEWYRGQSYESDGKVTQSLWRSRDDHVWTPDIEKKSRDIEVILETPRTWDVRTVCYMLWKTAE